jgi:hypothetical protein
VIDPKAMQAALAVLNPVVPEWRMRSALMVYEATKGASEDSEQGGPGSNTGHGHVWERPDGRVYRCGGPRMCEVCARDLANVTQLKINAPPADTVPMPQNADKAVAMWLIGEAWIRANAKERLLPTVVLNQRDVDHLTWIRERLVHVYGESPNVDFVLRLGEIIDGASAPAPRAVRTLPLSHDFQNVPGWEYETTQGPRKAWEHADTPPEGEGWERNTSLNGGFERFEYVEESYWRRRVPTAERRFTVETDGSLNGGREYEFQVHDREKPEHARNIISTGLNKELAEQVADLLEAGIRNQ